MTSTSTNISVSVSDSADLLAAVPHLIGFTPHDSLVVLTLHGEPGSAQIGSALRTEIPCGQNQQSLIEHLLDGPLATQAPDAVIAIVVGVRQAGGCGADCGSACACETTVNARRLRSVAAGDGSALPHEELIAYFADRVRAEGMIFAHGMWTSEISSGNSWWCYIDRECGGELPDMKSTSVAAALTTAGVVAFRDRAELSDVVAPEDEDQLAQRSARIDEVLREREERAEHHSAREGVRTVFGAIERTAQGGALTDEDLLQVLLAVSDMRVRDLALSATLGPSSEAAEQLWLALIRKAPEPEVADVAALLAFAAYMRGDGALASVALERIESTRPQHTLGILLRRALNAGIAPRELKQIAQDAASDARISMEEDDG